MINFKNLEQLVNDGFIRKVKHPSEDLFLFKYTEKATFEGVWNEETLMSRGIVLDKDYNIVANCIPKFFNIEEHSRQYTPIIDFNQPFSVTKKDDGSLIQVFMYNNNMIITSSGGFDNDYTKLAEHLLRTKYEHVLHIIENSHGLNYIFEMIAPLTTVVVNYSGVQELRLITVRDLTGYEDKDFIQQCHDVGFDCVQEDHFNSLDDLTLEKSSPEFKNAEGFVVKFDDGSRVKIKYDVYFTLHKNIAHASKRMVWDALSNGIELDLTNIPDETFEQIKQWKAELISAFSKIRAIVSLQYFDVLFYCNNASRKEQAAFINEHFKSTSGMLFASLDGKSIDQIIWKAIKPKETVQ